MPKPTTLFVGLNVHKDFITVAHAEAHRPRCTSCRVPFAEDSRKTTTF
jgi:hypothetical protein